VPKADIRISGDERNILGTYRKMSDDEWNKVSEWDKSVVELYRKIIDLDSRGDNGGQNHGASSANGNDVSEHDQTIIELWQKIKLGYEFYIIPETMFEKVSPEILKAEASTNAAFW